MSTGLLGFEKGNIARTGAGGRHLVSPGVQLADPAM
jgi:hypothetical protein